ncbi:hypothetical protein [Nitratireductor sp. GCM10026969]|uniref:hypothetical protein n=1 Tax=Nitratireductor sp. GCM10026969 TaxID=3252645 RepID=UPI003611C55E
MKSILAATLAAGLMTASAAQADQPTNLLDAISQWAAQFQNEDGEYDRAGSSNPTVADQFGIDTSSYGARKTGGSDPDTDKGLSGILN